ncbi:hypothetical protein CVT25_004695 [Psilocybe cyanescens]|uniref:Uncharacterized protein n=1 Tax=Psilocybe cyanescens TaxID=93625 RepID=A0A409XRG3_PSICY|nr:hypothetical protein CVT25_004695 [Psilocybe cyanescens]
MSTTKQTISLDTSKLPRFSGIRFREWKDKMQSAFLVFNVGDVLEGKLVAPTGAAPTAPPSLTPAADALSITRYQAMYQVYQHEADAYAKTQKDYTEANNKARGLLSLTLAVNIYEQVQNKTAREAWVWLETNFATEQFVETLETFKKLRDFKMDLSEPNPQIAFFRSQFTRLPLEPAPGATPGSPATIRIISESLACLILLAALPLTNDPTHESVYQRMIESYKESHTVTSTMTLDTLQETIRVTWASRFGHLPEREKPKKGTVYIKKGTTSPPKKPNAQKISAIADKGPTPKHSDQRAGGSSSTSDPKGKKPFTKKWKDDKGNDHRTRTRTRRAAPKHEHSHIAEVNSEDDRFVIASPMQVDMPALMLGNYTISDRPAVIVPDSPESGHAITISDSPSPQEGMDSYLADRSSLVPFEPSHSVASFGLSGVAIRNIKPAKARREAGSAPYPTFHKAKKLADRIGAQPTTQTLKKFEQIIEQDMDVDEPFVDPSPKRELLVKPTLPVKVSPRSIYEHVDDSPPKAATPEPAPSTVEPFPEYEGDDISPYIITGSDSPREEDRNWQSRALTPGSRSPSIFDPEEEYGGNPYAFLEETPEPEFSFGMDADGVARVHMTPYEDKGKNRAVDPVQTQMDLHPHAVDENGNKVSQDYRDSIDFGTPSPYRDYEDEVANNTEYF